MIPFNKPYTTGAEVENIRQSIHSGHLSGNGPFTKRCHKLLEEGWGFDKVLLTTSCTDALEMAALLLDIKPGDEVIVPAYTFVSTALAFARNGARIVFADCRSDYPVIDTQTIDELITERTKLIVPVHYSGIACDMEPLMSLAVRKGIKIVEDAAHAFGATYKGKPLGVFGDLGCFSFHETKVIHCGEGGMLSVNNEELRERAEVLWEKGTNRCSFSRGEVNKYEWIDTGSSFLLSDINASFLAAQLENFYEIIEKRKAVWKAYHSHLKPLEKEGSLLLPVVPDYAGINYSSFYIVTESALICEKLKHHLYENSIQAVTHYLDLSRSPYILKHQPEINRSTMVNSIKFQETLLRLPLYNLITEGEIERVCNTIVMFFNK